MIATMLSSPISGSLETAGEDNGASSFNSRKPNPNTLRTIPETLLAQFRVAFENLSQVEKWEAVTLMSEKNKNALHIILTGLEKLCDPFQTATPELQIQALSRITGRVKETSMGNMAGGKALPPPEDTIVRILAHDFIVPALLDHRVRYLHRGLNTLLRSICRLTEQDLAAIEGRFVDTITMLFPISGNASDSSEKENENHEQINLDNERRINNDLIYSIDETVGNSLSGGPQHSIKKSEGYGGAVMRFLNIIDCLSSTLVPLAPSIFSKTFYQIFPLLGESLDWCVGRGLGFSGLKIRTKFNEESVRTATLLGRDLEQIRFCVRVVASYVHKYLEKLTRMKPSALVPQFSRLIASAMMMLCSSRFPKDVLNATGLLVASLMTAKHCDAEWLNMVCTCICSTEKWSSDVDVLSRYSEEQKIQAQNTVVRCFCSSTEELSRTMNENLHEVQEAVEVFFSELTTLGSFALLKGILAHFSSPIHGNHESISLLLRPIPSASSSGGIRILYDLIQPITFKYTKATELPQSRFMAIQTLDAMVRHVDGILGHLRMLVLESAPSPTNHELRAPMNDHRKSKNKSVDLCAAANLGQDLVQKLCEECLAPGKIHNLCHSAMDTMMEVWDDTTTQVSGGVCGTFHVLFSIHKGMEFFSSDSFRASVWALLPSSALTGSLESSSVEKRLSFWTPMNTMETLLSVLSISSERPSKYHALLDLLSWMPCREFFAGLLLHFFHDKYCSFTEQFAMDEEYKGRASKSFVDDLLSSVQTFSLLLLSVASNAKVASAAGDTLAKFVERLSKEESQIKCSASETMLTKGAARWVDAKTVSYGSFLLSRLRLTILSTVASAMTAAGTVKKVSSSISVPTHISLISAHFVYPLMKIDKSLLNELLRAMTEETSAASSEEVDKERLSQSIVEVLMRAKGVGIDIQEHLQATSKTFPLVVESLQSFKFDQRITAIQLCTLYSRKIEPVSILQATIMYRFLALNMHLGGDTSARKTLMDTFRKWINRVIDSYERLSSNKLSRKNKDNKEKEQTVMDANIYASSVVVPHLMELVQLFIVNMGKTITTTGGLSVERKVTACLLFTMVAEALRRTDDLRTMVLECPSFPLGDAVSLIAFHLSDGWSQMRLAAKTLMEALVGVTKKKCLNYLLNESEGIGVKNLPMQLESVLAQIRSAFTFRAAEGAVQRYMLLRNIEDGSSLTLLKGDQHPLEGAKTLLVEMEQKLEDLTKICQMMKSQTTKELYQTVVRRPLHGLVALCMELFASLQKQIKTLREGGTRDTESTKEGSAFVLEAGNKLLYVCGTVIRTCGVLAGQEALSSSSKEGEDIEEDEEIIVDCRGHVYDQDPEASEGVMRLVVNNTWLSIRVASACLQRVVSSTETTLFDLKRMRKVYDDLVHVLLATKHNGVMRSLRASLTTLMEALLRCRAAEYHVLPGELLSFLLGPNGVSSNDPSRMLRRSQGLPHALLAILEAEDDRAPLVLFPEAMRVLLVFSEQRSGGETAVGLSQRSNALNVLKFIFENKRFAERMLPYAEAAFAIATGGFEDPNWGVRNSSLMLFSAVLPRLIGQSMATPAGTGAHTSLSDVLKRTPHCVEYAYNELCKNVEGGAHSLLPFCKVKENGSHTVLTRCSNEAEAQQDLKVLPVLQMFSMLTPDPLFRLERPSFVSSRSCLASGKKDDIERNTSCEIKKGCIEEELVNVVRWCGTSKNLMIRAACAAALPCILSSTDVECFIYALPELLDEAFRTKSVTLGEDAGRMLDVSSLRPKLNTIHGLLLQLQQLHARYLGAFESSWRALRSCDRSLKVARATRKSIAWTLSMCHKHFEAGSQCCPTVCSVWLNLLSDMLYFTPSCEGESVPCILDIRDQVMSGISLAVQMIVSRCCAMSVSQGHGCFSSSPPTTLSSCFPMFPWCKADWTSALNAISRFLILALRRSDVWNEATGGCLKMFGEALRTGTVGPRRECKNVSQKGHHSNELVKFSSFLCHGLHKFLIGQCITMDELKEILRRLETEAQCSLIACALQALEEGLRPPFTVAQRSYQVVAQSEYLDFLCDVLSSAQIPVPSCLTQNLMEAMHCQKNSPHHYPPWCGAGLRFLSLVGKREEQPLNPLLVSLLQYFGEPKRGQAMRAATLNALELLLPRASAVLQNFLHSDSIFKREEVSSASSLLVLLLQFLVDDAYDVRETACKAWKCVLPGSQIVKDQCSCVLSVVLALRSLIKIYPENKESVKTALLSLRACTASVGMDDGCDEEEVLFYKESDNMFFEETFLEELVDLVLLDGDSEINGVHNEKPMAYVTATEGNPTHWPALYEMLRESEKSQLLLFRLIALW